MKLGPSGLALIAAAATFGVSVAAAQTATPPPQQAAQPPFANPPYKNLKVFPATITRGQLLSNMKFFAQSLGVRCTYPSTLHRTFVTRSFVLPSDADGPLPSLELLRAAPHPMRADIASQESG